jgi:outer membrane protein OmpA-like peptidoglycan-associated protein
MQDENEDLGSIAWPGFVDILSSVIIMFVFFVMVVASALYFHIIIYKSKLLSEIAESTSAQSQSQELATTNRALMKKIKEMDEKMKILEDINEENEIQLFKQDTKFAESVDQKIEQDFDTQTITVFFGSDSISVTKENQDLIEQTLGKYIKQYTGSKTRIDVTAGKSPNAFNDSISRRLAVARMLNVRNLFLETEVPSNQIIPAISDEEDIQGSYNWVKITFKKK